MQKRYYSRTSSRIPSVCIQLAGILIMLLTSLSSIAGDQCEAFDCDCGSLPKDSWKQVCKERELKIKESCGKKVNTEALFCSAHGPAANRLPLDLKLSNVEVVSVKQLDKLNERVAALYWSVHQDLYGIEASFKNQGGENLADAVSVVERNIENLFKVQQQISVSWSAYEKENEAAAAWDDFSSDTLDMADDLLKAGKRLWSDSFANSEEGDLKARAAAFDIIRISGLSYEQSAYSFGQASEHDNAARAWKRAAEVAEFLITMKGSGLEVSDDVSRLRYQRAARLYRASYHWIKDEKDGEAENSLEKAQKLMDGTGDEGLG